MEMILRLMISSVTMDILPHAEVVQSEIRNFLGDTKTAALISNDLSAWRDVTFPSPLHIISPQSNVTSDGSISGIILDNRDDHVHNYKDFIPFQWDSDTKLVVLVSEKNEASVSKGLESIALCHVLVITVTATEIKSYRLCDMKRHRLYNVSFMDLPPNVLFTGHSLNGSEGLMFQTVADHEDIRLHYLNRHETEWGDFEPPSGLLGDVGSGSSIAGFGALYPFQKRYKYTDMVFGCDVARFAWAVPSQAGRQLPKWLLILVSELSPTVWLLTLLLYTILIPVSMMFDRNRTRFTHWAFHIFALFICVPQEPYLKRRLILFVLFFGFMFVSYYQTMMCSTLTAPGETPEIWTLKDLDESGLRLLGPPKLARLVEDVAKSSGDLSQLSISRRYEATTLDQSDILPRIALQRDWAYLRHDGNLIYSSRQDPRTTGRIHIVDEHVLPFYPVTLMPKHSCLTEQFQRGYHRLCDSGLGRKWITDMTPEVKEDHHDGPRKLTLEHIKGFFLLAMIGWLLALISFIAEVAVKRKFRYRPGGLFRIFGRY